MSEVLAAVQGMVDLAQYAPDPVNALESLKEELYTVQRTRIFHAKMDRAVHMPLDGAMRGSISASLNRLGRLYVDLAGKFLSVRRGAGMIAVGGVDMIAANLPSHAMYASDDRTPFDQHITTLPTGAQVVPLTVRATDDLSEPFMRFCIGSTPGACAARLPNIARICWCRHRTPLNIAAIPGNLTVDGVDTVEAQLGLRFGSARNLRTRYPRWPKFVTVVAFWCFFSSAGPQLL